MLCKVYQPGSKTTLTEEQLQTRNQNSEENCRAKGGIQEDKLGRGCPSPRLGFRLHSESVVGAHSMVKFTELSRTRLIHSQSLDKQDTPLWGARGQRMASRHRGSWDTTLKTQHQQGSTYVQTIINTPGERCQSQHPGIRKRSPFLPQGPSRALYQKCLILR